jgi:hypothetical protein
MAGGQSISSGQGSLTASESKALTGEAITSSAGTMVVGGSDASDALAGEEATGAQGAFTKSRSHPLRSRKVGGGSATHALSGQAFAAALGLCSPAPSKTPTSQVASLLGGSLGKQRDIPLTGSVVSTSAGTLGTLGSPFPLSIHVTKRYLVTPSGQPFLVHGDTAWSIVGQLTNAEIDTYLNSRQAKGFNTVLLSAPEAFYTSQFPPYNNVDGVAPFSPATSFTNPVAAYWNRVDYLVNGAKSRGMACLINPAYWGFGGDGWYDAINSASAATLQAYGVFLATRYSQGNIIWSLGGDNLRTQADRDKQWNIVTGMRTVRTSDLITAHGASGDESFTGWSGYAGWNLNHTYCYETDGDFAYLEAANAYGRAGPIPFIFFEGKYENSSGYTAAMLRRQTYQSLLSGACGQIYGNHPIWHFESSNWGEGYSGTWESHLNDTGSTEQTYAKALFDAYQWQRLVPQTGTTLVTTSLGTGASRIVPALANDGTFAMIYAPGGGTSTVNMAALTGVTSVRARFYDPTAGTYSNVTGTPFPNTGNQVISWPAGDRVLVLDQGTASGSHWTGQVRTTNGSRDDVQAKVTAAVDGDIVEIPAGDFIWTSAVTISGKGIRIRGMGGGRVEGSSTSSVAVGTGSKSFTIRSGSVVSSSGFTVGETIRAQCKHFPNDWMEGTVTSWNGTTLVLNATSTGGTTNTRTTWTFVAPATTTITHNAGAGVLFEVTTDASHYTGLSDMRLLDGTGTSYAIRVSGSGKPILVWNMRVSNIGQAVRMQSTGGVFWNFYADAGFNISSDYTNNYNAIQVKSGPTWNSANTIGAGDSAGTQNIYIEDSFFTGHSLGAVDYADRSRGVFRQSVLDNSGLTIHGQDTDLEGCRHLEVYDNLLVFDSTNWETGYFPANQNYWVTWRGGSGVVTDNISDNITSTAWGNKTEIPLEYQPLRRNAGVNACYSGSYPAPQQPGWGHNGSTVALEGVYVWNNTGTMAVTTVNYAPDECGGGPDVSGFIQLNRDYFLGAKSGYSKYAYPHPLRAGAT